MVTSLICQYVHSLCYFFTHKWSVISEASFWFFFLCLCRRQIYLLMTQISVGILQKKITKTKYYHYAYTVNLSVFVCGYFCGEKCCCCCSLYRLVFVLLLLWLTVSSDKVRGMKMKWCFLYSHADYTMKFKLSLLWQLRRTKLTRVQNCMKKGSGV